jgi:hypothetical protein
LHQSSQPEVGIGLDQVGDPSRVGGRDRLHLDLDGRYRTEEAGFGGGSELPADEVGGLGDDESGRNQRARVLDRADAKFVIGVGVVGGGEQNARIDDEQASVSAEAVGKELVRITGVTPGG